MKKSHISLKLLALLLAVTFSITACDGSPASSQVASAPVGEGTSTSADAFATTTTVSNGTSDRTDNPTTVSSQSGGHVVGTGTSYDRPWVTRGSGTNSMSSSTGAHKTTTPSSNPINRISKSLKDSMLVYFKDANLTKTDFLPCVGYYKDGKIVDTLFDSFMITWIWHYMPNATRDRIEDYYWRQMFRRNSNMSALNAAVGEVKKALNAPHYKVYVWIGFWIPSIRVGDTFGEVDGKALDFTNLEDRKKAIDWQMNTVIALFNEQNYEHLELAGFHCIEEGYDSSDPDFEAMMQHFTSQARARRLKTNWGPYYNAPGWDQHDEMGFDWNTLSPNYFKGSSPNAGGPERLESVGNIVKQLGIGAAMELESDSKEAIGVFKEYLKGGVDYGYMNTYHSYYFSGSTQSIANMLNNTDPDIRSTYDDLYKFIKRTLNPAQMIMW